MVDEKICAWLLKNADAPIRYRVFKELLGDAKAAQDMEAELLETPVVLQWMGNLKPKNPPQHHWMEHGSFDFCLENAMLKAVQLGLHGGMPQVVDAVAYYLDKMESVSMQIPARDIDFRSGFDCILTSNLLSLAHINNAAVEHYMQVSLDELHRFAQKADYELYYTEDEKSGLKGIPKVWKNRKIIKRSLLCESGYCYPFIYDIVGLHTLYALKNREVTDKINAVIGYISTDVFHDTVPDGYGIIPADKNKYFSMGWDPKYPGWYDVERYLAEGNVPKLLFFVQHIVKYPAARETSWFKTLCSAWSNTKQIAARIYSRPNG